MGGNPSHVAYFIDSFGHCSQLPQIISGFGMDTVVIMRGIPHNFTGTEAIWQGADTTRILALLVRGTYCFLGGSPSGNSKEVVEWFAKKEDRLNSYSATPHHLGMNGCDHTSFDRQILPSTYKN